jgi:hypothetical protein
MTFASLGCIGPSSSQFTGNGGQDMAANDRLELRRAFQVRDYGDEQAFPSEDEWKLSDVVYTIGVEVGYAKGFVHATTLLFTAMLAAAVWASM